MSYDLHEDNFKPNKFLGYHIEDATPRGGRTGGHGWKWAGIIVVGWAFLYFGWRMFG